MRVFGKTLGEYLGFAGGVVALVVLVGVVALVVLVGVARLVVSMAGVPVPVARFVSVTSVALLGAAYLAVRAHTAGFGGYRQLLPLMVITLGLPGDRRLSPQPPISFSPSADPSAVGGRPRCPT